jgi:cell division protein FtsQ
VLRRRLVALALLAIAIAAGYMLWFRDSSLVAVEDVEVRGVTENRERVVAALRSAALDMTTLHVREEELRDAVAGFPSVDSVSADASFPHDLQIEVQERVPVAVVRSGGRELPVSADGHVLPGFDVDLGELPPLQGLPGGGGRLDAEGVAQAEVIGAAPEELYSRIAAADWDVERGGVVLEIEEGPELRFGDAVRAEAKWEAAEAVLADPELGPVTYVDVSVPERPVAA